MPRNARCVLPGHAYHVTQRGSNKRCVFHSDTDRKTYLQLIKENLKEAEVRIWAWCLMSNHVHWVVEPGREDSLAVLFQRAHGRYSQYYNARRQRSGHLWQARFFSCVLSPKHLTRALRYVELNPLRAAIAKEPQAYRWSSARDHLSDGEQDRFGILDPTAWRERGGAEGWRELLQVTDSANEIYLLKRCTYAGRPFGEESFLAEMEERFGRHWRRWSFEPKTPEEGAGGRPRAKAVGRSGGRSGAIGEIA